MTFGFKSYSHLLVRSTIRQPHWKMHPSIPFLFSYLHWCKGIVLIVVTDWPCTNLYVQILHLSCSHSCISKKGHIIDKITRFIILSSLIQVPPHAFSKSLGAKTQQSNWSHAEAACSRKTHAAEKTIYKRSGIMQNLAAEMRPYHSWKQEEGREKTDETTKEKRNRGRGKVSTYVFSLNKGRTPNMPSPVCPVPQNLRRLMCTFFCNLNLRTLINSPS